MSQPKYEKVKGKIKEDILNEEYVVGNKIPSEMELAELFSVSRHTIRQAINGLVSEGYLLKRQGSGTFVSKDYLNSKQDTRTIGLITTYMSDYIFPSIIRGIEEVLSEYNYSLLLSSTHNNVDNEKKSLEKMIDHNVDGLIVEPTKSSFVNPNLNYYLQILQNNMPLLMLHANYDELSVPVIEMDDEEAGRILSEHLIELGHKNISMISKTDDKQGKKRMRGYLNALNKNNLSFNRNHILLFETETLNDLSDKIQDILDSPEPPTAFVCYNDQVAIQLIQTIQLNGKNVPDDYSVVSHDNSYLSNILPSLKLTSAAHPKEEMGRRAAEWIINDIEKKKTKKSSITFQPELKIGNSTKRI